ncbi:MAG: redoxin domain-containing protein [Deltaproteobacteria bacterium]|nr:redoxin domain-containing protein [Deltaproteobacteria bacterium]
MIEQIRYLLEEAFRQDSFGLYFLMFGGGLLATLTPCTYPVLPLTVGYIGNQAGANRLRAFFLSLSLVTGMAAVYAVLGSIVAAVGGTFGSIMGNGWVVYAIALFYLMMGLALLDVFPFPVPGFISRLQTKSSNRQGVMGAFVIGGVSGLIVGPCTGPILAVALGAIALTLKNVHGLDYTLQVLKGGVLLFLFGFGQGALILLAGIFTGFISKLPRAGAWMEAVKKGFALLVIIASSLLFVFVGQNTDFPSLTRVLATAEPSAAPAPKPDASPAVQSGKAANVSANPAPDFTLASLGKGNVTLSRLKGKKGVVLVFFATWCVSCVQEVPEVKRFAEIAKKENVVVFGIDYKQSVEIVERFQKSARIDYGILLDMEGTVTLDKFGIRGLPHVIGINAKGDIIYRGTALPDDKAAFINNLQQGL